MEAWTAARAMKRVLPRLEAAGRAPMRMPDPGKKRRRHLADRLVDTPELIVLLATFAPRVQRQRDRKTADEHDRGKQQQPPLKVPVTVHAASGASCASADRVLGPQAEITTLAESGVPERLPDGVGMGGDLASVGIDPLHPHGLGGTPRRHPPGQERPPEDIAFNRACSKRRIGVAHPLGRIRRYESLAQRDRNHRQDHSSRVRAGAGLVNRQLRSYASC